MSFLPIGAYPYSVIIPNNTTGVVLKADAGVIHSIEVFTINTSLPLFIRFYNQITAPGTSDTPVKRLMCPTPTSGGGGFVISFKMPIIFTVGMGYRATTGFADNDATAPTAANYLLNIDFT